MAPDYTQETFKVWASDNIIYGPVDLAALCQWVREGRVFSKTWIHVQSLNQWRPAEEIEPLQKCFADEAAAHAAAAAVPKPKTIAPEELRQFPLFSGMSHADLEQFLEFGELVEAQPEEQIIKRGDPSDALFFVLTGTVRVRLMIGYDEKILGRLAAGECFGEVAMFTRAPRSADVLAEQHARLLRLSSQACLLMVSQLPQIAAPLLFGIAQMMAGRILEANARYQREVAAEFVWR